MAFLVKAHYRSEGKAAEEMEKLISEKPEMEKYLRQVGPTVDVKADECMHVDILVNFFMKYTSPDATNILPVEEGIFEEIKRWLGISRKSYVPRKDDWEFLKKEKCVPSVWRELGDPTDLAIEIITNDNLDFGEKKKRFESFSNETLTLAMSRAFDQEIENKLNEFLEPFRQVRFGNGSIRAFSGKDQYDSEGEAAAELKKIIDRSSEMKEYVRRVGSSIIWEGRGLIDFEVSEVLKDVFDFDVQKITDMFGENPIQISRNRWKGGSVVVTFRREDRYGSEGEAAAELKKIIGKNPEAREYVKRVGSSIVWGREQPKIHLESDLLGYVKTLVKLESD